MLDIELNRTEPNRTELFTKLKEFGHDSWVGKKRDPILTQQKDQWKKKD